MSANAEERRALLDAIQRAGLTETKLIVVLMTALGWTQDEIGAVLGLDQRTVSYHWADSVKRLQALCPERET